MYFSITERRGVKMREIDLSGSWQLELENGETGEITLPGILQGQGFGEVPGKDTDWVSGLHDPLWYLREEYRYGQERGTRVPFMSQPPRHYLGKAYYSRTFEVPCEEEGRQGRLWIECTKWQSQVWLDGKLVGQDRTLCAPHEIELGALTKGQHTLRVCLDNSMLLPYRPDGHGVTEALGGAWNGMAGRICVRLTPAVEIRELRVYPDYPEKNCPAGDCESKDCEALDCAVDGSVSVDSKRKGFEVRVRILNHTREEVQAQLGMEAHCSPEEVILPPGEKWLTLRGTAPAESCWDEFTQRLEEVTVTLYTCYGEHSAGTVFGFRDIRTQDGLFLVNGRPSYLRGTHFGGDYPITGYPECGMEWWRDKLRIVKEWGLNFIRFHSYCPPEAAFRAADEAGVYLQVECGMWNVFNEEDGSCPMAEEAYAEAVRIIRAFGNHPSFVMLSPSNEPGGEWLAPLSGWVERCRMEDDRRLYTIQSGWPYPVPPAQIEGTDYVYFHRSGFGLPPGGTIRNTPGWMGKDYRESLEGIRYPVICHELGQWCSYPDYRVTDSFGGYLEPSNFEVFRESLKAHGMEGLDSDFAYHSGKLQVLMYKEELEANFRTPHMYGFELLDLHDYLGQGTALVGVLDAFWQPKGYVTPEEWKEFCGQTVLLARLPGRVFVEDEKVTAPVEICHFGREPLEYVTLHCRLERRDDKGTEIEQEAFFHLEKICLGKNHEVGEIELSFAHTAKPSGYTLTLEIQDRGISNHWDLWVYPGNTDRIGQSGRTAEDQTMQEPQDAALVITESWSAMQKGLEEGKRVLFCPPAQTLDYSCPPFPFRPAFWNAQMGPSWGRGMGIICDAEHPAFRFFPTDTFAGWQWEQVMKGARGFNLEHMPQELPLLVRAVDEWNRNLPMALLFECRVGEGRLVLSTLDLLHGTKERPAAAWLRRSLEEYMASDDFCPAVEVNMEAIRKNYMPHYRLRQKNARIFQEEKPEQSLSALLDGDGSTFVRLEGGHPYVICLEWDEACAVKGLYYLPRQNERNHEGEIRSYRVEAWRESPAGGQWEMAAAGELPSSFAPKRIFFESEVCTDRIRLTVLDGFGGGLVRRYHEEPDGWHSSRGPWQDVCFAAAALDILTDEAVREEFTGVSGTESSEKSATREIDI